MGLLIGGFGESSAHWYGADPAWRSSVEREARRVHGRRVQINETPASVTYRHLGMHIAGRDARVPIEVRFYRDPYYATYGLHPKDYPRVFADRGAVSKHRMPLDDALCLYDVQDGPSLRWTDDNGLHALFDLAADHLFYEDCWRAHGEWPVPDAPHGFAR